MKPRYDSYYRSIPDLGGRAEETDTAARPRRPYPNSPGHQISVLEATHPDIAQAITLLWGYPEMNSYFEKLWLSDGRQAPIAPEAMSELMLLAGVHRWLTPEKPQRTMASIYSAPSTFDAAPPRRHDVWDSVPRRR
jgi:hypothetical protein